MTKRLASLWHSYGALGLLRVTFDWVATKLTLPHARLLRRPFAIRGMRWIRIGAGFTTGPGLRLEALPLNPADGPVLVIGNGVQLNDQVHIAAVRSVTLGNRVLIASKVFISDHNHGNYKGAAPHDSPLTPPAQRTLHAAPVIIEDDVWIGEFVAVLPGVRIGRGAIIGAMSTVTRNVPAYTIAVGSPARVIRRFNFESSLWEDA